MIDNKLSKLKMLKKISLTDEERNLMRAHAARIVIASPAVITESFFKRGVQHGLRIALSSMLFIVFITGSVSEAAKNTLPGDSLYPVKLYIDNNVKGLVYRAPDEKAVREKNLIASRLSEIQTLASSNSLTPAKQAIAAKALSSNVANLSADLNTLSAQSPSTALTVTASLEQTLKQNKTALENTPTTTPDTDSGKADAIQTVNATLQKVSDQETQILSQEITNLSTAVTTVPTSASASASLNASGQATQPSVTTDSTATQTPSTPPVKVTPVAP